MQNEELKSDNHQITSSRPAVKFQFQDEACFVEPIHSDDSNSLSNSNQQETTIQLHDQVNENLITKSNSNHFISSKIHELPKIDFLKLLPIELTIYILLNIGDHPQSLVNCRLVSKYWRQCAEDPIVWRENFISHPHWKVKHLYPKKSKNQFNNLLESYTLKINSNHDDQSQSNLIPSTNLPSPIPNLSMMNSIQSYRSNGSANKQIARRISELLLFESNLNSSSTTHKNHLTSNESNDFDQNQIQRTRKKQNHHDDLLDTECLISLDWLKLYRDRFILDQRWSEGKQTTRSLKGHKDSIYCLQINGDQIISGSRDRTIKMWDIKTGVCTNTLTGHKGSVLCVRCDGQTVLTGSSDCQVFVWEETEETSTNKKWKVKQKLIGHQSGVLDLGFDDKLIASCSKDTTIKIWNRQDGTLIRTITGHTGPVNALELYRNPLKWIEGTSSHDTITCQINDQNLTTGLLTASGDSTMKLWELQTGRLVRTFEGHIRGLACLKLIEEENLVVTGSNDETIKFWNLITGQCLKTLLGHSGLVRSLDIDLAQNRLISGSYDKTVKVWDLKTGEVKLDFRKGERRLVFDVKVHLTSIVLVGHDSSIMMLDFSHGLECDNFI